MLLKERVMDPSSKDEISEAFAYMVQPDKDGPDGQGRPSGPPYRVVPTYMYHWYPDGLKERTIGPASRQLVGMTRYYQTLTPPVVVDFEPAPPDKFWEDEKRRFCAERGIVYMPVYLLDRMNIEQFRERYSAERDAMEAASRDLLDDRALKQLTVEGWMIEPQVTELIDRHTIQILTADEARSGKRLYGIARTHVVRRVKQEIVEEVRRKLRSRQFPSPVPYLQEKVAQHGMDPDRQPGEPPSSAA